jgi:formylglycine-generating enzyme
MRANRLVALSVLFLSLAGCSAGTQQQTVCMPGSAVHVPAGWFLMGQDEGLRSNQPQRSVFLDAYAMDCTEVTNSAFSKFVEQAGTQVIGWDAHQAEIHPDHPVTGVLWKDALAYCQWLGERLPTEAEWEKAARGADGRRYPWGDAWDASKANTLENGKEGVLPVGSYPEGASPYGLLDMAGNAAEWVADYFDFTYYTYAPDQNPQGPELVLDRGLRGGSWASTAKYAQTFYRDSSHSVKPNLRVGFRCTLSE